MQSLTLKVEGRIDTNILMDINGKITPKYLRQKLRTSRIPKSSCDCGTTIEDCIGAYDGGVPTKDDTLKLTNAGFYGTASGCQVYNKIIVKGIALKGIREVLRSHGIRSKIDYWDIDSYSRKNLAAQGVIRRR